MITLPSTICDTARHDEVPNRKNIELQTCLLNCMIPRVGNTHALAGGMISESAKLTHCSTWAAAWGVAPRRASLLTVVGEKKMFKKFGFNYSTPTPTVTKSYPLIYQFIFICLLNLAKLEHFPFLLCPQHEPAFYSLNQR